MEIKNAKKSSEYTDYSFTLYVFSSLKNTDSYESFAPESDHTGCIMLFLREVNVDNSIESSVLPLFSRVG